MKLVTFTLFQVGLIFSLLPHAFADSAGTSDYNFEQPSPYWQRVQSTDGNKIFNLSTTNPQYLSGPSCGGKSGVDNFCVGYETPTPKDPPIVPELKPRWSVYRAGENRVCATPPNPKSRIEDPINGNVLVSGQKAPTAAEVLACATSYYSKSG